jgi:hypothetical protein
MSYKFESKRDELYFRNYHGLRKAIEAVNGNGDLVINKLAEELLTTLANNGILLNPVVLDRLQDNNQTDE